MTIENDGSGTALQSIEGAVIEGEVMPSRRPQQEIALGQLFEQVEALEAATKWAEVLCAPDNELCPAAYRGKTGSGVAAILYGAELGLNPTQSLQQVFVVHGSPAIYARTAVALCKRAGIIVETVEESETTCTVKATDRATGQVEQSTWTIDRASKAGYTSNKKYTTNPQQMLYAKAAMEVCRKVAPDILLGIPMSREELDLEAQPIKRVEATRGRGVEGLKGLIGAPPAPPVEPTPEQPEVKIDGPVTPEQLRELSTRRKAENFSDSEEDIALWLAWVERGIGRKVESNKDLTSSEAADLITALKTAQEG